MKTQAIKFSSIVDTIYSLSLEERLEIKTLLEHSIADTRRKEIASNFKNSLEESKSGKLKFSSKISDLKKML